MRTPKFPKPEKRGPKPAKPIRRGAPPKRGKRPGIRAADRHGDHRARVKYANDLWRRLIYKKEPSGVCPRCRTRPWHEAAHCWIKGSYYRLRFDLSNGAPLCRVCHRRIDSDHHAKEEFFRRYIGDAEYERLRLLSMARGLSKLDLMLVIIHLETLTRGGAA